MALVLMKRFCYKEYSAQTKDFALWLSNYVQSNTIHGRVGWLNWFMSKTSHNDPNVAGWKAGVLGRAKYHGKLKNALSCSGNGYLIGVVNEIIECFHGMKGSGFYLQNAPDIRRALSVLATASDSSVWSPNDLYDVGSIASLSKVYQMLDPHKWTIYDSRVATSLACLARRFWSGCAKEKDSDLIRFPVPSRNMRGWKKPEGFPGCSGSRQACLGFIYASWVLRQVAEIMRSDSKYGIPPTMAIQNTIQPLDGNWQVYHLEMALWMLGDKEF